MECVWKGCHIPLLPLFLPGQKDPASGHLGMRNVCSHTSYGRELTLSLGGLWPLSLLKTFPGIPSACHRPLKMRLVPCVLCTCSSSCAAPLWWDFWAPPCQSPASSALGPPEAWLGVCPSVQCPQLASPVGADQTEAEPGLLPRTRCWGGCGGCLLIMGPAPQVWGRLRPWVPFVLLKKGVTKRWLRGGTISLYCSCPSP